MDLKVSPKIELAIVHGCMSLAAIVWLERTLHLSSLGSAIFVPYALLIVFSSVIAYIATGFFLSGYCSRIHRAWASVVSIAIPAFTSILAAAVYYVVGYVIAGPSHFDGFFNHMEFILVVPLAFFYAVWPVVSVGTAVATLLLIRRHQVVNAGTF